MWPVTHQWNIVGRWYYDLPENRTLDVFGGVEYESCCWAFRVVARRFITSAEADYNTGIFFQFELKGLAGIGQNTADYLRENIPGYQSGF
jgi:LPS-assembly protein